MTVPIHHDPTEPTLWRVVGFGHERYSPGRPYRWANASRRPVSQYVAQLTLDGQAFLDEPVGRTDVEAGQLMLFRYGEQSVYGKASRDTHYACRWVTLDGAGLAEHFDAFRARHASVMTVGQSGPIVEHLARLIALADPAADTPRTMVAEAVHAFVHRLFEHAEQGLRQRLSPAEQAVAMILDNPYRPWSMKQLAAEFGVSREHLSRVFTGKVGRPPHRHLTEARLKRGLRLIRETNLPLREIAEQTGFETAHNLARHVRRTTGRSPTALRHDR